MPGHLKFSQFVKEFFRIPDVFIFVYRVSNPVSFREIDHFWISNTLDRAKKGVKGMLIGNVAEEERRVSQYVPLKIFKEGQALADKHGMGFIEINAKTGEVE